MTEVTLGIAVLLSAGLLAAKISQLIRLPSVTGFILVGLVLGPSFFGLITVESVGHRLEHFTQIALMLIAFGIGEHIELRRLGNIARDVSYIAVGQAVGAFFCVFAGTYLTVWLVAGTETSTVLDHLVLALLLGAIATATAPAALLHLVKETNAKGPLTSTLMAVVAVDDGIAIMIFGLVVSLCHQFVGPESASLAHALYLCVTEIVFSLAIGITTGLLIDFSLNKLQNRGEMLTGGLALLLLCGETTRLLHLSPLLAGMAAGFTIINRAERDVRLFRAINAFEPPIFVLFFTMAGAHLELSALQLAGWVGIVYFLTRVAGKYFGAWAGGFLSGAPALVRNYLGLALVPQAGVAIGLVILVSSDQVLAGWSAVITRVVLAGVVLSELCGPVFARYTIEKAGEAGSTKVHPECGEKGPLVCRLWLRSPEGIRLQPWESEKLHPAAHPSGVVAFGTYHFATVRGLARIATILAHHYHALPLSVRILNPSEMDDFHPAEHESLFMPEKDEVGSLGYPLKQELVFDTPASGLVSAIEYNDAHAVVLGYPIGKNPRVFHRVLDTVASNILCPLIAVHFVGTFKTDRILVPFQSARELNEVLPILEAMAMTTQPHITFLHLLNFDTGKEEIRRFETELQEWLADHFFDIETSHMAEAVESSLEMILHESQYHDLIIMAAARRYGLERMFFGSLSNSVVMNCRKPVIVVHTPEGEHGNVA